MPHIEGLTITLDPQSGGDSSPPDSPDPFEGEAYDSTEEFSVVDTKAGDSPDPDEGGHEDGGDYEPDIEPDIGDEDEDWGGDRPGEELSVQEGGEVSDEESGEVDPWQITINGEPALQFGGIEDELLSDDEDDGSLGGGAGGGAMSDDDEGDAGSDEEDTVRLIDGDAARRELAEMHPTIIVPTDAELDALALVVRDSEGAIIDENHSRTSPWMNRFERARVLGTRASQLSHGAPPQIEVPEGTIDSLKIAIMELEQNQIPFVIRRPLPDGSSEYWPVHELEQLA